MPNPVRNIRKIARSIGGANPKSMRETAKSAPPKRIRFICEIFLAMAETKKLPSKAPNPDAAKKYPRPAASW